MARIEYGHTWTDTRCAKEDVRQILRIQCAAMTLERTRNREIARSSSLGKIAILEEDPFVFGRYSAVFFSQSKERPARRDLHAY